jgi:hypothetical protein
MTVALNPPARRRVVDDVLAVARPLSAAVGAGALAGFVIGGVGGRIAMFVLRLTSDPGVRGLESDDGFTIGIVSSASLFLLGATTVLGLFGGVAYLLIRAWLPPRTRPWVFGALCGLVGGALVIRPGGIDFTRLSPLWLAVSMFVALPAAYGVTVARSAERLLPRASGFGAVRSWVGSLVVIAVLALTGITGLAIVAAAILTFALARSAPVVTAAWSSRPTTWIGRAGLAGLGVVSAIALVSDVVEILR